MSEVSAPQDVLALEVEGIEAGYGPMTVLRGLSLHVGRSEIVGVLGANGMGKSTLMKTLAGVLEVKAGSIRADGVEINALATHSRTRLGISYVQQGRGILPTLTTRENLRMAWNSALGEPEETSINRVFGLFPRLELLSERMGGALSGGEQQLLALARALVPQPWLLLLDEPTEGIQPSIIDEMAQTLVQLRERESISILVAEQNLDFILDCADRVLMLEKGAIVQEYSAAELRSPQAMDRLLGWGAARSTRAGAKAPCRHRLRRRFTQRCGRATTGAVNTHTEGEHHGHSPTEPRAIARTNPWTAHESARCRTGSIPGADGGQFCRLRPDRAVAGLRSRSRLSKNAWTASFGRGEPDERLVRQGRSPWRR